MRPPLAPRDQGSGACHILRCWLVPQGERMGKPGFPIPPLEGVALPDPPAWPGGTPPNENGVMGEPGSPMFTLACADHCPLPRAILCSGYRIYRNPRMTRVPWSPSGGEGWRACGPLPTGWRPPAAGGPWGLRQAAWPPRARKRVQGGNASLNPSTAYVLSYARSSAVAFGRGERWCMLPHATRVQEDDTSGSGSSRPLSDPPPVKE